MEQNHYHNQLQTYVRLYQKTFYLCIILYRLEYIRIPLSAFPEQIIQKYSSIQKAKNGFMYVDISQSI